MDLNKLLDAAIKKSENGSEEEVYITIEGKAYENYMSNEKWEAFLKEMKKEHLIAYVQGYGNEISEKPGRYGICPPKMASYGSSSRMIYNLLKKVEGIHFEKQLPTKVGGTANLDGYLQRGETEIFIEAKCREIYASHTKIDIGEVYKPVYEYIKQCNKKFGYSDEPSKASNKFKCSFYYDGKQIIRFDIKQLICHFLAIVANYLKPLNGKDAMANIRFVYFIYNPNELGNEALDRVYAEAIGEISKNDIIELFKAVFEYQKKKLKIEKCMPKFEFTWADQNDIKSKL